MNEAKEEEPGVTIAEEFEEVPELLEASEDEEPRPALRRPLPGRAQGAHWVRRRQEAIQAVRKNAFEDQKKRVPAKQGFTCNFTGDTQTFTSSGNGAIASKVLLRRAGKVYGRRVWCECFE